MLTSYITRDPKILGGKPIITNTRISVELIMRKFANGYTMEELLKNYPHLKKEQIQACFEYSANVLANEEFFEIV